jgi:hypothetical protein
MKKNYGTISVGKGIEGITLGMSRSEVKAVLGEPEESFTDDYEDGTSSETFDYPALEFSLDFGSEDDFVLNTVRLYRKDIRIFDKDIVGLSVEEALALFAENSQLPEEDTFEFTDDDGVEVVSHEFEGLGLTVWFSDDYLDCVQISTLWEDDDTPIYPWKQ